jgi:hypothetical protein
MWEGTKGVLLAAAIMVVTIFVILPWLGIVAANVFALGMGALVLWMMHRWKGSRP